MKPRYTLILILLPILCTAQSYFTIGTEVDVRNALFGGTVNDKAYNGFHSAGYTAQKFRVEAFYEHFEILDYESFGMQFGYLAKLGQWEQLNIPILAQISTIHRPNALTPSLGLVSGLEYHLGIFILGMHGEGKWRSDFEKHYEKPNKMVFSGRVGIKIKL